MSDRPAIAEDPHVQALITKWLKRWTDGEVTLQEAAECVRREFWADACMVHDDSTDAQHTAPARQSTEVVQERGADLSSLNANRGT